MQENEIIYEDIHASDMQNNTTIEEINPTSIEVGVDFDSAEMSEMAGVAEVSEAQDDINTTEVMSPVEVASVEVYNIEMFEAFAASEGDDAFNHALLNNRELHDQHPISAITGLREELDSIEALQTIYSDKKGNADYYEWADGHALGENGVGYFVSLNKDVRTISICTGDDIFGVVVDDAAFVGGQDDVARDAHYGLVATSGVAHVRCELDVAEGDYVTSNTDGVAEKTDVKYGYKVIALHNIKGERYATISLDISGKQAHSIGAELQNLDIRMDGAESNIVAVTNLANQAYNKANKIEINNQTMSDKVDNALGTVGKLESDVKDIGEQVANANVAATQANAIANITATSVTSMREETVKVANSAWQGINDLTETLEPIVSWEDAESGTSGVEYLTTYMNQGLATTLEVQEAQTKTEQAMSAIQKNAKELQALVTTIDKYSVGAYSQANNLPWDQAKSILEVGMIYVPTSHEDMEAGTSYHKEEYSYVENNETKVYTRWFTPGYLYRWDGAYWITVGNNAEPTTNEDYSDGEGLIYPTATPWVFFAIQEPFVSSTWEYGYWYTNGDIIQDKEGNEGVYEPYTLYKWEEDHWLAVATLKGNSNNRAIAQIRIDSESLKTSVSNAYETLATIEQSVKDNEASIGLIVENGEAKGGVIIEAINNESTALISADRLDIEGKELNIKVAATNITGSLQVGSLLTVDTNNEKVSIAGFTAAEDSLYTNEKIEYDDKNEGVYIGADGIGLGRNFYVSRKGEVNAIKGRIGGLDIYEDRIASPTGDLTFQPDGTIIAQKFEILDYFRADYLLIDHITGLDKGDATLYFDGDTESSSTSHTGTISVTLSDDGDYLIIKCDPELSSTTQLEVKLTASEPYRYNDYGTPQYDWAFLPTIPSSTTEMTVGPLTYNSNKIRSYTPTTFTYYTDSSNKAVYCEGNFSPSTSGDYRLGSSEHRWEYVHTVNGVLESSDRNEKNTIMPLSEKYGEVFDKLTPVTYKFNVNTSDRLHLGLIAQEVKQALDEVGIDSKDFAAYCEWIKSDGTIGCGIRYTELISLNIYETQKLKSRVTELEEKLETLLKE